MHYRDAFNQTLEKFSITAKSLAQKSGVQERQISQFRHGKDLMSETLFGLIAALPNEAKIYYFSCVNGESMLDTVDLPSLIAQAPPQKQAEALHLIAEIFAKNVRNDTDTVGLAEAV
jgi:transcriptional regulator with XRE-family HTH domain